MAGKPKVTKSEIEDMIAYWNMIHDWQLKLYATAGSYEVVDAKTEEEVFYCESPSRAADYIDAIEFAYKKGINAKK